MPASSLVRQLLDAGVHFGHQTKRWNPKMKPFIFGSRSGIYIIDLEKTEQHLERACDFLEQLAAKGQLVLFVGTKKQAKTVIEQTATRSGMPYVVTRWLGGTMTNFPTIKRNIERLLLLRKQQAEGYFERLPKKDALHHERELAKLQVHYAGLAGLDRLPAGLFVIDPKRETNAVHEANRLKIPVVAICDTNADPDLIAYPIPGNDDAIRSVQLISSMVADCIIAGRRQAGLPLVAGSSAESETTDASDARDGATTSAAVSQTPATDENLG